MKRVITINIPVDSHDKMIDKMQARQLREAETNCWDCGKILDSCCMKNPINDPDNPKKVIGYFCCGCYEREHDQEQN